MKRHAQHTILRRLLARWSRADANSLAAWATSVGLHGVADNLRKPVREYRTGWGHNAADMLDTLEGLAMDMGFNRDKEYADQELAERWYETTRTHRKG